MKDWFIKLADELMPEIETPIVDADLHPRERRLRELADARWAIMQQNGHVEPTAQEIWDYDEK